MTYKDSRGYARKHSNAVHRHRAYHHIYLKDRKKYPLSFEAYEVHHIDGNKENNRIDNLEVLTPEEHDERHEELKNERISVIKKEIRKRTITNGVYILVLIVIELIFFFYTFNNIGDTLGFYLKLSILFFLTIIVLIFIIINIGTIIGNLKFARRLEYIIE